MSGRGRWSGPGRGGKGRGPPRGSAGGGMRSEAGWGDGPPRGFKGGSRGRGASRGFSRGRGSSSGGHDDRGSVVRHVRRDDNLFKSRRGGIAGRSKGRGKGKGDGLYRPPGMRGEGGHFVDNKICHNFSRTGSCAKGSRCTFLHVKVAPNTTDKVDEDNMARHCEVVNAHAGPIVGISMTEQGIFTASQDKTLKRWKPQKDATGRYQLIPDQEVPMSESVFSMYCSGGWIFCGLWDGSIKAFSVEGANSTLLGHTKRVTAIIQHQGVLISGAMDRDVRLWQMDPGTKAFNCTHTLNESLPGAINCLHALGENLWVGGMSGIAMCSLTTLKVTKLLPPVKSVVSFLEFQGHVIAAYADGGLRIFDGDGSMKSEMANLAGGPIHRIAGLDSGPRVLCGHSHGQVTSISLPEFAFKAQFQAFMDTSIDSVMCAGQDGLFLLGSKTGNLQLWQRLGP